jgi:flagellar motor switch protein FliG
LKETKEVFEILKKDDHTVKYPPFETFLAKELKEIVATATFKQITDIVNAFIQNALTAAVNDDEEKTVMYELMSKKVYADYQNGIRTDKERGRRGLAPYNEIRNQVVKDYIANANPKVAAIIRAKLQSQQAAREEEAKKNNK